MLGRPRGEQGGGARKVEALENALRRLHLELDALGGFQEQRHHGADELLADQAACDPVPECRLAARELDQIGADHEGHRPAFVQVRVVGSPGLESPQIGLDPDPFRTQAADPAGQDVVGADEFGDEAVGRVAVDLAGVPVWAIRPSFMMTTRSAMANASDWLWVT